MTLQQTASSLIKARILVAWIVFLLLAAVLTWSQRAANVLAGVTEFVSPEEGGLSFAKTDAFSPEAELAYLLADSKGDPPPVGAVLNDLVKDPRWDNLAAYTKRLRSTLPSDIGEDELHAELRASSHETA